MPGPRAYAHLHAREWAALLRAAGLVLVVRGALGVLPFARVLCLIDVGIHHFPAPPCDEAYRRRAAWAVEAVARRLVPAGPCLTQALVVYLLLRRRGYPADLRIGVAKGAGGGLRAHAWVECAGEVVIGGGEGTEGYRAFPLLQPSR